MNIQKKSMRGSPFIGIFASVTEKIGLFPVQIDAKEIEKIEEFFEIEVVQASIANSSLIGCLVKGNSKGFIVPEITEEKEIEFLQEKGIKIKVVKGLTALGNLVAVNDFGGIASPLIEKKTFSEIKRFLGVNLKQMNIANSEVVGSCIVASNKGFIVHPEIKEKELKEIESIFKVKGAPSTANYGDPFVANDILANSKGVLIGEYTSNAEMLMIDEGLRRD
ncbi:MAG: translation initiation factor IF-6 [archaeon]